MLKDYQLSCRPPYFPRVIGYLGSAVPALVRKCRWADFIAMPRTLLVLSAQALVALLFAFPAFAAPRVQVIREDHHDRSRPLRAIVPSSVPTLAEETDRENATQQTSQVATVTDPVVQQSVLSTLAMTTEVSFDGIGYSGAAGSPPDANGAAGSTQFVQWANSMFGVFSKSSGLLEYGPAKGNTLWSGFGGPCQNTNATDGIVLYDKMAGRWVVSRHAKNSNTGQWYQCIAVSTTSDATGSYNRYAFLLPNSNVPDYPKLGVWPDAYYLSLNQLSSSTFVFQGAEVCALQRNAMLRGTSASMQCFQLSPNNGITLLPSDLDGTNLPPAGSPNFMMNLLPGVLQLWQFHVDFGNPENTSLFGPTKLFPAIFNTACGGSLTKGTGGFCIPQLGTSQVLDALSEEGLMYRLAYRNFGTYDSMVVTHSVGSFPTGVRWYEIRNPGSHPIIHQQSTYRPDANFRFVGSAAMDKMGNIAVGYSVSGSNMNPAIAFAGRLQSDPLGTLEAEQIIMQGTGSQINNNRWGDYTSMSVDPSDDCTFWYTNEYLTSSGNNNWSTRIASFRFSNCQ